MPTADDYNPDPGSINPGLFDERGITRKLGEAGLKWPGDFAGVEPLHDVYGVEVCGIRDRVDAVRVLAILRRSLPEWKHSSLYQKEEDPIPGWAARIARYREREVTG